MSKVFDIKNRLPVNGIDVRKTILGIMVSIDDYASFVGNDIEKKHFEDFRIDVPDDAIIQTIDKLLDEKIIQDPMSIGAYCFVGDDFEHHKTSYNLIPNPDVRMKYFDKLAGKYAHRLHTAHFIDTANAQVKLEDYADESINFLDFMPFFNNEQGHIPIKDGECAAGLHTVGNIQYLYISTGNAVHMLGKQDSNTMALFYGNKLEPLLPRFNEQTQGLWNPEPMEIMKIFFGKNYDFIHQLKVE